MPSRARPCDMCRKRKTRCVKPPDKGECILCAFHGKRCTYLQGPTSRARRRSSLGGSTPGLPSETRVHVSSSSGDLGGVSTATSAVEARGSDDGRLLLGTTQNRTFGPSSPSEETVAESSDNAALSLLNGTLGLDLDTHPEFVGPSHFLEPALLDLYRPEGSASKSLDGLGGRRQPTSKSPLGVRRVDAQTLFLVQPDEATASETQRLADCDAIEDSVRPLGKALVDLYFRIVHPSFPVLHKGVFLAKHAVSHRTFSPPLLAAVYLIALDYQAYHPATAAGGAARNIGLSAHTVNVAARQAALEQVAERTMAEDLKRPKLSTLQAGLLLLQRSRVYVGPSGSMYVAQMVALAQVLGLHVDCQEWAIPEWEKGLRRRLAWALYSQDRWYAVLHGRPLLLSDDSWGLRPCSAADFLEVDPDDGEENGDREPGPPAPEDAGSGTVDMDTGRAIFMKQIELAQLLSQIMARFYVPNRSSDVAGNSAPALVEAAKPLVLRLREWRAALPPELALDYVPFGRLSNTASLHVAHAAVEVTLQRVLLRAVTPDTPPELTEAVRSMAKARVQSAVAIVTSLQPEHTGAFWHSAAAYQVALIGSLAGLLWATTESAEELAWCASYLEKLRWSLQVRGQSTPFMLEALRLLDSAVGSVKLAQT